MRRFAMASIDTLLKLHPDTVMSVRRMYNFEKPGDIDKAVELLDEWLKKQLHLTRKEFPREYLERSIIHRKGSVERAKCQIDRLCSMRSIFPNIFNKHDARNDFNDLDQYFLHSFMPDLMEDHYRVYVAKFVNNGITTSDFLDIYRYGILLSEYNKYRDYCCGYVAIFDFRHISLMDLITTTDLVMLHQIINILMEGYGVRVKGIHGITSSKAVEKLVNIIKPMLGTKLGNRIHVHRSVESLYEYVPQNVLPADLGGYHESLAALNEKWKDHLGTKEYVKFFKEMNAAVSNDAHKMREKLNGMDLGIAGTFRTLNVD